MVDDRKNIKVSAETFRELDGHKSDVDTWDAYLRDLKDAAQGGPVVGLNDAAIEAVADEVETRLGRR